MLIRYIYIYIYIYIYRRVLLHLLFPFVGSDDVRSHDVAIRFALVHETSHFVLVERWTSGRRSRRRFVDCLHDVDFALAAVLFAFVVVRRSEALSTPFGEERALRTRATRFRMTGPRLRVRVLAQNGVHLVFAEEIRAQRHDLVCFRSTHARLGVVKFATKRTDPRILTTGIAHGKRI